MPADGLGPMERANVGAVGDLMATTKSASNDSRAGRTAADGGEEAVLTNLHRNVVMLFFVSEGAGHTAAASVDLLDGCAGDAIEEALHSSAGEECLLMAVAVDENLVERRAEAAFQITLLNLAVQEFIDHHHVFFYALAELLVVDEVGQVVNEGGAAAGLADDYLEALLDVGIEIAEGSFAEDFGLSHKAVRDSGSLTAAGIGQDNFPAAGFEQLDG